MKTVKQGTHIIRVKESEVDVKLKQGFVFCPKSEWKSKVRDNSQIVKTDEKSDTEKKVKGNPKGKAKKTK